MLKSHTFGTFRADGVRITPVLDGTRSRGMLDKSRSTWSHLEEGWMSAKGPNRSQPGDSGDSPRKKRVGVHTDGCLEDLRRRNSVKHETSEAQASSPTARLASFVQSERFNVMSSLMIAANGVYLGIQTDYREGGREDDAMWYAVDIMFSLSFLAELFLRISVERCSFLLDGWNIFDTVVVLSTCVDTFVLEHGISDEAVDGRHINLIAMLRVARCARLLRLLRFLKELWLLVIGLLDAMRSLVWAWTLIGLIIYVFAILMTRSVGHPHRAASPFIDELFGTVPKSMFTLFTVMTLEDWPAVSRDTVKYEEWVEQAIVVFLLVTTFSIMNVIVAVVVESTLDKAGSQQADKLRAYEAELSQVSLTINEVFNASDSNRDGKVSRQEFHDALRRPDVRDFLKLAGFDGRQANSLFDILDFDDSGWLSSQEFTDGLLRARGGARARDLLTIQCQLWKGEARLRVELQELCLDVDSRMDQVDNQVDLIRKDLERLGRRLGVNVSRDSANVSRHRNGHGDTPEDGATNAMAPCQDSSRKLKGQFDLRRDDLFSSPGDGIRVAERAVDSQQEALHADGQSQALQLNVRSLGSLTSGLATGARSTRSQPAIGVSNTSCGEGGQLDAKPACHEQSK